MKTLFSLTLLIVSLSSFAQQNQILKTYENGKNSVISEGSYVRLSYPSSKLENRKPGKIVGLRGLIDSIGKESIYLKINKRSKTNIKLDLNSIVAIKKASGEAVLPVLLLNYAVLGGGAFLLTKELDVNPAVTVFSAVAAIFPASIITGSLFYPAKPHAKVGKDYTLKVISVYN